MKESGTVGVTAKSVLEKPLHLLTEDDISQLTREDCRRYLKEKGMRRPSWNKSQAIQQVISLKSLLDPTPLHFHFPTPTVNSNSSSSFKELSAADADADVDGSVSAVGDDGGPISSSEPTREGDCRPPSIRGTDGSHIPFDQRTIFYGGGVNVYDGVPVEKAQAIMHLPVSPTQLPQDEQKCGNLAHWSSPCQLPSPGVNLSTQDKATPHSLLQDVECQSNRQVSLQRYLEKRKDRGKFKKKIGSSLSGLEMYLNNQMRSPVINGQNSQNNAGSKSHLGIPCSSFGLFDSKQKNQGPYVDLND